MKINIDREKLLTALKTVQPVAKEGLLAILGNALFVAESNKLTITATNLDLTIKTTIDCEVEQAGAITLPIKRLNNMVKEMVKGNNVSIEVKEDDSVLICSRSSKFKLLGLPVKDFPPIQEVDGDPLFTIQQKQLKVLLYHTSYAASKDETRRVLQGNLLSIDNNEITSVATDGRRLSLDKICDAGTEDKKIDMIIPSFTVTELKKVLTDDGDISVWIIKNNVALKIGDTFVISKLVDGVYPNYRQVIPNGLDKVISVNRENALSVFKRVSIISDGDNNSVKLTIGKNEILVHSSVAQIGEAKDIIPIAYTGEEITVSFNPDYIIEILESMKEEEVFFCFDNGNSPCIIRNMSNFMCVVIPLRLQ